MKKTLLILVALTSLSFSVEDFDKLIKQARDTGVINETEAIDKVKVASESKTQNTNTPIWGENSKESNERVKEVKDFYQKNDLADLNKNVERVNPSKYAPKEDKIKKIDKKKYLNLIRNSVFFTVGNGTKKEYYLFLNISDEKSQELIKNREEGIDKDTKIHVIILTDVFDMESIKKSYWILSGKTIQERLDRSKLIFKDKLFKYKKDLVVNALSGSLKDDNINQINRAENVKNKLHINKYPLLLDGDLNEVEIGYFKKN